MVMAVVRNSVCLGISPQTLRAPLAVTLVAVQVELDRWLLKQLVEERSVRSSADWLAILEVTYWVAV